MLDPAWEREERAAFCRLIAESETVVDIGANAGYYACLAKRAGKHVIAFEPHPSNLAYLLSNLCRNQFYDVEVYPVALSDHIGVVNLFGNDDVASLVSDWAGASQSTVVPCTTLDVALGERLAGRRLVIKLDVEGHEEAVLGGASQILSSLPKPTWIVEALLRDPSIPGSGANPAFKRTFERFWAFGYEASLLDGRRVDEAVIDRWIAESQPLPQANFVFQAALT